MPIHWLHMASKDEFKRQVEHHSKKIEELVWTKTGYIPEYRVDLFG